MNVLDLFSGIGGFSLGLERAGMRTVQFCEIDPYCRAVLAKHWPAIPCHDDVRTLTGVTADVICGGFPCQDISIAGNGVGLAGGRSGLWTEYRRLIGEVRPRFAIMENVSALLGRGLGEVLGDLATLGYDADWHCIPACAIGAPHERDRIWIVAYPNSYRAVGGGLDTIGQDIERHRQTALQERQDELAGTERPSATSDIPRTWSVEPAVGRMAHGIPARMDRLKCLGNAVVPQIPEIIGRAIMKSYGINQEAKP